KVLENAKTRIDEFDVRTPSGLLAAGTLSGGNQQKVVMARELSRPLRLFIASQPTRGVDVGSIEFLHKRIVAERDQGTPVMIVSTELDEVIELADRIAVLYKGKLVGIVPAGTGRDVLGLMMAGLSPADAQADTATKHHAGTRVTTPAHAAQPVQESHSGAVGEHHD
ncbi:MAG: heme transporter ATP-binding protein, partial [Arthrobacter sp.]|nr:heme transporter ATP-binding protein [Arthrobacter sp.]